MSDLAGALCVGRWWLFDSTEAADHDAAKRICAECPALIACDRLLREVQTDTRGVRFSGGGPGGTWAGKLVGKPRKRTAQCGTDSGYHNHRKVRREEACEACLQAHAEAEAGRVAM